MQAVVEMGDTDEDGLLDFRDFMNYCADHEKKLWLVFQNMDTNQDGESWMPAVHGWMASRYHLFASLPNCSAS